jgi:hypothetical protein
LEVLYLFAFRNAAECSDAPPGVTTEMTVAEQGIYHYQEDIQFYLSYFLRIVSICEYILSLEWCVLKSIKLAGMIICASEEWLL